MKTIKSIIYSRFITTALILIVVFLTIPKAYCNSVIYVDPHSKFYEPYFKLLRNRALIRKVINYKYSNLFEKERSVKRASGIQKLKEGRDIYELEPLEQMALGLGKSPWKETIAPKPIKNVNIFLILFLSIALIELYFIKKILLVGIFRALVFSLAVNICSYLIGLFIIPFIISQSLFFIYAYMSTVLIEMPILILLCILILHKTEISKYAKLVVTMNLFSYIFYFLFSFLIIR